MIDFELEKVVGYLIAGLVGSVVAYFQKMRRDITQAHRKIRKIQKHLDLGEDGECLKSKEPRN